ncbi:MAG: hypothetical protein K2X01_01425 [Cyanobacteria bacterium]|nr:hypothetical protein [Cyanobacteriota bacterium]
MQRQYPFCLSNAPGYSSLGSSTKEYALIAGICVLVFIAPLTLLGNNIKWGFENTNNASSEGLSQMSNLLRPDVSASNGLWTPPPPGFGFNLLGNGLGVNLNGIQITNVPVTAGNGTSLVTYVYGLLISQLAAQSGLGPTDPLFNAIHNLGNQTVALATVENTVLNNSQCQDNLCHELQGQFDNTRQYQVEMMNVFNGDPKYANNPAIQQLVSAVNNTYNNTNQLYGFNMLQTYAHNNGNGNGNDFSNWANHYNSGNQTPPSGLPPVDLSAITTYINGRATIDGSNPSNGAS